MPDLSGRTAIVTGANTGIGLQVASGLAKAGATVVMTARDRAKGQEALAGILRRYPAAIVRLELLDLADMASISDFTARVEDADGCIDILVNNAGVMTPRRRLTTKDGHELQIGVNFLGHFALTARLLGLLRRADAARVVSLSSIMHKYGKIDLSDLESERRYSPIKSYSQSKLATLIFARELQRRADDKHWNLLSVAAHPGIAQTELVRSRPGQAAIRFNRIGGLFAPLYAGTAADGALSSIYAATSDDVVPGGYYGPTGFAEIKGPVGPAKSNPLSNDTNLAGRLWKQAEHLTGLRI